VADWRAGRLARLTAPDSWLSLIGRFPLEQGKSSAGAADGCDVQLPGGKAPSALGTFERNGASVSFTPAAGVNVTLRASARSELLTPGVAVALRTDRHGDPDMLVLGAITLEVTQRESGFFVRVRDPDSSIRRAFAGIDHYPIDLKWRVVAKLERYEPHKEVDLGHEAGTSQRYASPGAAVFEIEGIAYRVDPVLDGNRLYLMFWDATARDSTYGAGRFLYAPLPRGDRVLLDFNQAFSPPCAFTPYAACPLAPMQNRLMLRVEAGEKRPYFTRSAHNPASQFAE
jgi:uncharacterized protein (DUF1684 family)